MKFKSEKHLFDAVLSCSDFNDFISIKTKKYLVEPKGLFGIPDLVVVDVDCVRTPKELFCAFAFEMKLSNWKRAIMQAFRYRSFAEKSYVLLDAAYLRPALKNIDIFQKTNIGLLSIDCDGTLIDHYQPQINVPYCANLRKNLENLVLSCPSTYEYYTYI